MSVASVRLAEMNVNAPARSAILASRVIDAALILMFLAMPLLSRSAGRTGLLALGGVTGGAGFALLARGSRAQRLSRCAWLVFLAAGTTLYLSAAAGQQPGVLERAAVRLAAGAGGLALLAWVWKLAQNPRAPRLTDTFDWAALISLGVLGLVAIAFVFLGERGGAAALGMPAAVLAMHFIIREQARDLGKARRLAQVALGTSLVALLGAALAP